MRFLMLLFLLATAVFAGDGTCKEFTIWNPTTNDTLYHFFRKPGQFGDCWIDYHAIGKRIEWSCGGGIVLRTRDKKEIVINDSKYGGKDKHDGQMPLHPYIYTCISRW